ncbi:ABC transporter permease [Paenibacillus doosanensis]|uniref:ABC transporter permease YtrF n=1 Tax=Paenibacillus konkukensis TaxID=2020716 RepID=A0ABY4RK27_9BACL|nr:MULTISPECIES: ABC transporter permease [Paenibacillus]MCS7460173.1 ABC transporter permease [Paenibacillus doosanensis]UQZ82831.1 ABC transporter permease YtrF precursor [Paenibacillus konkukensis]
MKLSDYLKLGWEQLRRRVVVTALCCMGIAIGSASIIVALSFGESINHYSKEQMSYYIKSDEITVRSGQAPEASSGDAGALKPYELSKAKIDMMRTLPHVKALATYQTLDQFQFEIDNKRGYLNNLYATELDSLEAFGSEFAQGGSSDMDNSIILSYGATMGLIDEQLSRASRSRELQNQLSEREASDSWRNQMMIPYPVYQKQIILKPQLYLSNGTEIASLQFPLRVVGILKKPEGVPDDVVMNMKTAYISPALGHKLRDAIAEETSNVGKKSSGSSSQTQSAEPEYGEVKIKVDDSSRVREVEELVKKLKLSTETNLYREEQMQGELVILRLVFGGVGLFILFVASISIIVAMTMSTYQRRRQIGIMKVLGANLRQIRNMFMVESALLGVLGGMCGILLSYWVIWGINIAVLRFSPPRSGAQQEILFISPWILPVGLFFAVLTGVLSGIYPAVKASRTDALTAIKRD